MHRTLNSNIKNVNFLLLTPAGRSGSVFFQALCDGHSEIISLPTLHYKYDYYSVFKNLGCDIEKFVNANIFLFNPFLNYFNDQVACVTSLSSCFKNLNLEKFITILEEMLFLYKVTSNREFIIILHFAWALFLKMDIKKIKYILFHYHLPLSSKIAGSIVNEFPNVFCIITARHPLESALSWKRVLINRGLYNRYNMLRDFVNYPRC